MAPYNSINGLGKRNMQHGDTCNKLQELGHATEDGYKLSSTTGVLWQRC